MYVTGQLDSWASVNKTLLYFPISMALMQLVTTRLYIRFLTLLCMRYDNWAVYHQKHCIHSGFDVVKYVQPSEQGIYKLYIPSVCPQAPYWLCVWQEAELAAATALMWASKYTLMYTFP